MANNPAAVVELVITHWLDGKQFLLFPILDQLAKELAPIVAEQAAAELKTRLAGLQTRDDLLDQVHRTLREVRNFLGGEWYNGDQAAVERGEQIYELVHAAFLQVEVYRGLNNVHAAQIAAGQAVAGDVEEGGAS